MSTISRITLPLILVGMLLAAPILTQAWTITDFTSAIAIQADGSVTVTETIHADFAEEEKHGIYRDIPIAYDGASGTVYSRVEDIVVTQDGESAETDISRDGSNLNIRIGDPDITITGTHIYTVAYRVVGVLRAYNAYDELYWNVTGNGWDAPILKASAFITLPAGAAQVIHLACYKGAYGTDTACETIESTDTSARFATKDLAPGEGLTAALGFTQGVVPIVAVDAPPSILDVVLSPITIAITLISTLGGFAWLMRHWWFTGRDRFWQRSFLPGVRSDRDLDVTKESILPLFFKHPVVVEYDSPDGLRPAELGVLMDEKADTLDVSATILDLASRGYLEITEVPKKWLFGSVDYTFNSSLRSPADLLSYEALLLKHLFMGREKVNMSELKDTFYEELKEVKDALYKEVVDRKLFAENPEKVRATYIVMGIVLAVMGGCALFACAVWIAESMALAPQQYILMGIGIAASILGVATLIMSPFMPRKSGYGRELYQRALGYKLFVSGTEKYRAKFYEDQNMFVAVLPYAIVLGVTDKLARAFKDMGITPPTPAWYHGSNTFNAAVFAGSMNDFSKSLGTAMASAPSSSGSGGGGFSGGGFGGGGGGSW